MLMRSAEGSYRVGARAWEGGPAASITTYMRHRQIGRVKFVCASVQRIGKHWHDGNARIQPPVFHVDYYLHRRPVQGWRRQHWHANTYQFNHVFRSITPYIGARRRRRYSGELS